MNPVRAQLPGAEPGESVGAPQPPGGLKRQPKPRTVSIGALSRASTRLLRVLDEFGGLRLTDLRRPDLQGFIDGMVSDGLNPSTIQVTLLPLQAMFRRAVAREQPGLPPGTTMG
jgi:hypothetical protein